MKRKITKALTVLLILGMLLPQTALAATTYYIEIDITGDDADGVEQTIRDTSSRYGTSRDGLVAALVQLVNSNEGAIRSVFAGTGLSAIFEEGQDAYNNGDWTSFVDSYAVGASSSSFKNLLRDTDAVFGDLTVGQENWLFFRDYRVTVTLRSFSTGSDSDNSGSSGGSSGSTSGSATTINPDGSTTETTTKPDGTTSKTTISKPTTDSSGNINQTTTETTTGKDGITESKTETTTKPDGSGFSTTTSATTKPDGSTTESKTETTIHQDGSTSSTTMSTTTNTDGTTTESKTEATTSAVTNANGSTTVTKQETTITNTGDKTERTTITTANKDGDITTTTTSTTAEKGGTITASKTETTSKSNGSSKEVTTSTVTKPSGTVVKSTTETVSDANGSSRAVTTSVTTKIDGTTVESTTKTSANVTADQSAGTVTEIITSKTATSDGVRSEGLTVTEIRKDGTVTSKETVNVSNANGTTATKVTTTDSKTGTVTTVKADVSEKDAAEAAKSGAAVTIPVEANNNSTVDVNLPSDTGSIKVNVPVAKPNPGLVVVMTDENGNETLVPKSVVTEDGLKLEMECSAKLKIVDNGKSFRDVPDGHWANGAASFVSARNLFNGVSENTFAPDRPVTRAMMSTVLYRLESEPEIVSGVDLFDDVYEGTYYADGVVWANENGVVTGYGDGTYKPDRSITRQQLAAMLYRYAGTPDVTGTELNYPDANDVYDYAEDAMNWAVSAGIIRGTADGELNPHGTTTRAQAATMMMRYCENMLAR